MTSRTLFITLLIAAFFLGCGGKQNRATGVVDVNGQPFQGPNFGVSFPSDWVVQEKIAFTNVMAIAPKSDDDPFTDSISVVLENLPEKMTAEQYKRRSLPLLKQVLTDFEVVSEEGITLPSGLSASLLRYQHTLRDITIVASAMYVTSGKGGYVVTGAADSAQFETYAAKFDAVFQSFVLR